MTQEIQATELVHGQRVRFAIWSAMKYATVGTVEGYSEKYGEEPAGANAVDTDLAWANLAPSILTNSDAFRDNQRMAAESATVLMPGELVRVEGRYYTVEASRGGHREFPQDSDSLKFRPRPSFFRPDHPFEVGDRVRPIGDGESGGIVRRIIPWTRMRGTVMVAWTADFYGTAENPHRVDVQWDPEFREMSRLWGWMNIEAHKLERA